MRADDAEARILESVWALVSHRVQLALPEDRRGLRAREPIRERVPRAVEEALDEAVRRVATEVVELVSPASDLLGGEP